MLKTISIDEDLCMMLPLMRRYAGVGSEDQDSVLLSCLRNAVIEIQDRSGRTFAPCTMRLEISCNESTTVKLCGDGIEVDGVFSETGNKVAHVVKGNAIDTFPATYAVLAIDYHTKPEEGERARLEPLVLQYATALYDGQTEELGRILAQC